MPTSKISMEFAAADNIKNQKTTKQMYNDENACYTSRLLKFDELQIPTKITLTKTFDPKELLA
ncbi:8377_t:CDS:1, partial [Entrophospora sp. SA101]